MKSFVAFALLIAGISSLPPQLSNDVSFNNERVVTDYIASTFEDLSQDIRDRGLDPFYIPNDEASYALPVPIIFNVEALLEEFIFRGLSDIILYDLKFSIFNSRLRLGIELPLLEVTMKKADCDITLFGRKITASAAGRFAIKDLKVHADMRVGLIGGIHINTIKLLFKVGGIDSELAVNVAGYNPSTKLNTFLGTTIPRKLNEYEREVNELLEFYESSVLDIINELIL